MKGVKLVNGNVFEGLERTRVAVLGLSFLLLTSCGGGGGDDDTGNPDADELPAAVTEVPAEGSVGVEGTGNPIAEEFPVAVAEIPVDNLVPASENRIIPTEEVVPFRNDSPYADVLKECATATDDFLCANSKLPYIGQDHPNPTIDDILNRVLVSHHWMGVRFAQLLQQFPEEAIKLFKPVTVITIGSEVRPSVFYSYRGSIELDPSFLWLTLSEKRTVSIEDDFRSNFGADLKFVHRWRLMLGNEVAYPSFSLLDDEERTLNDIVMRTATLLFHELAHANDFVRPELFAEIDPTETPKDMLDTFADRRISQILYDDESLSVQRSWLFGLANVRFRDEEPIDEELAFTAETAGAIMGNEGKTTFYSYSTIQEDLANLFEAAMMKKHFGVDLYSVFAVKPPGYPDEYECNDLVVGWGDKNRLAASLVAPRARFAINSLLGESAENENFFNNNLGEIAPLPSGVGWCDIIFPPEVTIAARNGQKQTKSAKRQAKFAEEEYLREMRSPDHFIDR